MSKAYLTIDDAPSENFEEKVEFLEGKNIPAIFFCEGRYIEKRMGKSSRSNRKRLHYRKPFLQPQEIFKPIY